MKIKKQIHETSAQVFTINAEGCVKIKIELYKKAFMDEASEEGLLKGEWGINWPACGTKTINYTNDFLKVLQEAVKLCGVLNTLKK